jgi:hypothetical protein
MRARFLLQNGIFTGDRASFAALQAHGARHCARCVTAHVANAAWLLTRARAALATYTAGAAASGSTPRTDRFSRCGYRVDGIGSLTRMAGYSYLYAFYVCLRNSAAADGNNGGGEVTW